METEEYRNATYEMWQAMAAGWDRERTVRWEATRQVSERLLDALELQPGQTILELASGTGETGLAAAPRVEPGGRAILTDFAPNMVAAARRDADALGLEGVEVRQMDAERMDLPDDSVDAVLCRWGYMLMPDPPAALAETRRVLRDGGRLAFSVWAGPEHNQWAAVPGRALLERTGDPPPDPNAPGMFYLADSERLCALLGDAGFPDPRLEEVEVPWRFAGFDDYWHHVSSATPFGLRLPEFPEDEVAELRARVESGVARFGNGELIIPGLAVIAAVR